MMKYVRRKHLAVIGEGDKMDTFREKFAEQCRKTASEGAVLLLNECDTLPVQNKETVSVFGRIQKDYYKSGMGSGGAVNVLYTTNILDSLRKCKNLRVNENLAAAYEKWIKENPFDDGGGGWAAEPWGQKEMPVQEELVKQASEISQKAIVVIGRNAGEEKDYADAEGSFRLSEDEQELLYKVTKFFKRTAVVLNTSGIVDMAFLDEHYENPITAVLYTWHGGQEGGNAAADIISGKVSPSGKLPVTIAKQLAAYPSAKNYGGTNQNIYEEDIYVGYRFFETFSPEMVRFPFGFGLSYAKFDIEMGKGKLEPGEEPGDISISVSVKVTNVSRVYAGKEVVQVYYQAPQGVLGRPVKELGGFAKTKLLQPGEAEELTIDFPLSSMAAYDDGGYTGNKSCYVLEEGEYRIFSGSSIYDVTPVMFAGQSVFYLDTLQVIRKAEQACAPSEVFERLKPFKGNDDKVYQKGKQKVPVNTVQMEERIVSRLPGSVPVTGARNLKLSDVKEEKVMLAEFIAQLSEQELAALVRGEGMCSPRVTPGIAAAFGGVTEALMKAYGIPACGAADGPSGIRMDVGTKATLLPAGTLLASTFNTEQIEKLYEMEGKELRLNGIDVLLGPGLNIQRNPLNGRNFEYFSEDPHLTGKMAAAVVRGVSRGGATATLKHYACNNQEQNRTAVNSIVSERALREIYLKGFEIAVKEGGAMSVMTAYNLLNGIQCASNYDLNTTILRKEWGFSGIVMTDWWAAMNDCADGGAPSVKNTKSMIRAQNDIYMVVDNLEAENNPAGDNTLDALQEGTLSLGELQRSASNICSFIMETLAMEKIGNEAKGYRDDSVRSKDASQQFAGIGGAWRWNRPNTQ